MADWPARTLVPASTRWAVGANGAFSQTFEPSRVSLDDKIGFLSTPEGWPGRTRRVTVLQTHHAWLFMTDRYVYKMKKPFRAGGMAAELAYFTMECRHAGFGRVAKRCISEYRSRCPGSLGPGHLMDFYASLAATVRAGLMGWRALETPVGDEWRQRTVAYLKDAQHYIDKAA